MPYKNVSELPPPVKNNLPIEAQKIYIAAFNSAYKQHSKEKDVDIKSTAIAWAAVKNKFKKNKQGKWIAKKIKEAIMSGKLSDEDKRQLLQTALDAKFRPVADNTIDNVWVLDVWDAEIVYRVGEQAYKVSYKIDKDGNVTFGEPKKVARETVYKPMESLQTVYSEIIQEAGRRNASADEARIKKIIQLANELLTSTKTVKESKVTEALTEAESVLTWLKEQAIMKTDNGVKFPASAYAYVPDKEKSSTWKLLLWEDPTKKITRAQLGRAAAALSPGGFRGQRVQIPTADLPAVKRKIRAEYKKLKVKDKDIPRWVKEAEKREPLTNYVSLEEAKFNKGIASVIVIKPGFNIGNGRYYPPEVLKRDYKVFEGAKMYADHPTESEDKERPERSIRDWVGTLNNVEVKEDGTIIGKATIVEPWLQAKLARLRDSGMLSEMGISINAIGSASDAEIEGIKTKLVEKLIKARSVDFVTEAGAGGSVEFYESGRVDVDLIEINQLKELRPDLVEIIEKETKSKLIQEVKKMNDLENKVKDLEGQITTLTTERDALKTKMEEAEKAQKKAEAKSVIDEAVSKSELPDAAKARILEKFKDVESAEGIEEAIKSEKDYIAAIQESGKVKDLGKTEVNPEKIREALKESFKRMNPDWTDEQLEIAVKG